jgi:hypothetical protein
MQARCSITKITALAASAHIILLKAMPDLSLAPSFLETWHGEGILFLEDSFRDRMNGSSKKPYLDTSPGVDILNLSLIAVM